MIKNFVAHCKPSQLMRRMLKHQGDVSEADKAIPIAVRTVLGRKVRFFASGEHIVSDTDLTEEEQYHSEILRFAHASLIVNEPVGDKRKCWVDATKEPCDVWLFNQPADRYMLTIRLEGFTNG